MFLILEHTGRLIPFVLVETIAKPPQDFFYTLFVRYIGCVGSRNHLVVGARLSRVNPAAVRASLGLRMRIQGDS